MQNFFLYIGPKERNNLKYLRKCARADNPVTKNVVNKCVIQICLHCRSCVSFVLVFVPFFLFKMSLWDGHNNLNINVKVLMIEKMPL